MVFQVINLGQQYLLTWKGRVAPPTCLYAQIKTFPKLNSNNNKALKKKPHIRTFRSNVWTQPSFLQYVPLCPFQSTSPQTRNPPRAYHSF